MTLVSVVLLLSGLVLLAGARLCAADDLYLVRDGRPASQIVLPVRATALEAFAAEELKTYIRKSTGADLEVVDDTSASRDESLICIGRTRFSAHFVGGLETARTDAIVLRREETRLLLIGRDSPDLDPLKMNRRQLVSERGTLNAVYEFLEGQMGVRWYWPGEIGGSFQRRRT